MEEVGFEYLGMSEDEFFRSWPRYMQKLLKHQERQKKDEYVRTLMVANPARAFVQAKPIKMSDLFGNQGTRKSKEQVKKEVDRSKRFYEQLQKARQNR